MKRKYKILCFTVMFAVAATVGYNVKKNYNREFTVDTVSDEEAEEYSSGGDRVIDGRININTADAELLATLEGIGNATAVRIVEYRNMNGLFENIEDIMDVHGIGEKKFSVIKDEICCTDNNAETELGQ